MEDDVLITYQHRDTERHRMAPGSESTVDGLRVREYECPCGFSAALLSRNRDLEPGPSWPFQWRGRPA